MSSAFVPAREKVLVVDSLDVVYFGPEQHRQALFDVSFSVSRGERVAIVGESGSGKSTIARAILGALATGGRVTGGTVRFGGSKVLRTAESRTAVSKTAVSKTAESRTAVSSGAVSSTAAVGYVPQDTHGSFNPLRRVGPQVGESLGSRRALSPSLRRARVEEIFGHVGLPDPAGTFDAFPHQLSGGMRQRSLIAAALVSNPSLLIADEPTSALDASVQQKILDRLDFVASERGIGVLIITHDLGLVRRYADTVIVLKGGRIVEQGAVRDVLASPRHPYTRTLVAALLDRGRPGRIAPLSPSPPLVVIDGVSKRYGGSRLEALAPTSLHIDRGTTLALVGESGSGKTTLGNIVLGSLGASTGAVHIGGIDNSSINGRSARNRNRRREVQAIFQDPRGSLDPRYTVERTLTEALQASGESSRSARARLVREALEQVGLDASILGSTSDGLSGGQSQRVAIARAIIVRPRLIVCDEPTSALDVVVQQQILALLIRLQNELGITYIFISHNLAAVREIAHTIAILRAGVIVESGGTEQIFLTPKNQYTRELLGAALPRSS